MAYNKFRWWASSKMKKKLPENKPLLDRIRNGDFEYSPYFSQADHNRELSIEAFNNSIKNSLSNSKLSRYKDALDASRMKRVKALKLDMEAEYDERKRLYRLRKALTTEFGKDLWEKCLERQRGKGTTEDMYWWYYKQTKK